MLINITFPDGKQDQIGTDTIICLNTIPDDLSQLVIHSGNIALKTATFVRWESNGVMRYNRTTEVKEAL